MVPAPSTLEAHLADRYRIERMLGRGGMGAVHLARDLRLDRQVAIKELPAEFASDATLAERFRREVRLVAGFSHPNIVPVYGLEEHAGGLAFVMGYVEGESLTERVRRSGPLAARETVRLLLDVAYALAYAHGRGIVHRDIKPDNIMIERATGRALLMDFGVARPMTAVTPAGEGMTRVGEVVGTPEYMSPEQATGDAIDGRSDLYSLGLVAHFAVTGRAAFAADSAARVLMRQLTEVLPPLGSVRSGMPKAFTAAVDRCLAKAPDDRFADAAALIEALDSAHATAPEIAVPVRLLFAELTTLQIIAIFSSLVLLMAASAVSHRNGDLNALLPAFIMLAVSFGRAMQVRSEVRRLRTDGFSPDGLVRGLRAVIAEREERRAQLRANPTIVAKRRSTVRAAILLLVMAGFFVAFALSTRRIVDGRDVMGVPGLLMVLSAMMMLGFGMVLLFRNPLRAPVEERLFTRLFLGSLGRRLLGFGGAVSPAPVPPGVVTAAAVSSTSALGETEPAPARAKVLESIDARLARIEQRLGVDR